ncbi:hypothetical protein RB25_07005 [Herbaspirillum rubrisubalbicans]|uniref:Pvc16 N-terminal domain-containing protein n=1 Tax=Herbaspirillum rubrisubalbicans TaxID=80842 RepID=A0ABX9C8D4_9BURK|nr:DUF4255 domain-containing protein [Herbaspirillum rubrisubalbicans]RAM67127.1 hypothetical protein RB24_02145 [Herbaspirillum rubrisubalbicans]RAN49008.1 hypothetical protein RB25_07005 [Herbaspirillum rubrisubalbicans]
MIDTALAFTRQVLEQYLVLHAQQEAGIAVLNGVVDFSGNMPPKNQNKIVITLVNLEYETNKQYYGGMQADGTQLSRINPSVFFNLDILISACFDSYSEALKLLTASISFFQNNVHFTRENSPTLPAGISALKFEIENSPSLKTHNLWTAMGAKYLPSIIYKIRHVAVQAEQIKSTAPMVANTTGHVQP